MEREIKLQKRYGILHGVGVISGLVFGSGIYVAPSGKEKTVFGLNVIFF